MRHEDDGFTVVEVAITAALTLVAAAMAFQFFIGAIGRTAEVQASTQLHAEARGAVDTLVRELRQAYTGTPERLPLEAIGARAITFYSPDTRTPMGMRLLEYKLEAGALQRRVTRSNETGRGSSWTFPAPDPDGWATVARVQDGDAFTGVDATGAVTTDAGAVDVVRIRVDARNGGDHPDRRFETAVELRNVG